MSPLFPRTMRSRLTSPSEFPDGFAQWGQSGKGQFRSFDNIGRMWQEVYASIDLKTAAGRALIAAINKAKREKTIWDIQHPHYTTNYGTGGGSPTVDGASQTGSTLNIASGDTSVTNWLRDGDIIQVAGLQHVIDVVGDVDTDPSGDAAIPVHPPIFTGNSPANGAAVEIDASQIYFKAVLVRADMPDIEAHGVMSPGLTMTWREQPTA